MSDYRKDTPSAFPTGFRCERTGTVELGMDLRDYFAAKAMQGLVAQSGGSAIGSDVFLGAKFAYEMADAMLDYRDGLESDLLRFKRALVASDAHRAKLEKACEEFKNEVMFSKGELSRLNGQQTSVVLDAYDATIGAALDYTKGGEGE